MNIFVFSFFRKHFFFIFFPLLGGLLFFTTENQRFSENKLEIFFFDVPGDAIFFHTPEGHKILIDGGGDATIREKIAPYFSFWDRKIDLIVVTHLDRDHIFGALEVMKYFDVNAVFLSGVADHSPLFLEFQRVVKEKNIPLFFAHKKNDFRVGTLIFDTLSPKTSLVAQKRKDRNNDAVVQRVFWKNGSLLLTGDIEKKRELSLVKRPVKLQSDILKVAHHGSKTSTDERFLSAVSPKKSIIFAHKKNPFGHPNSSVVDRLSSPFITKEKGDISLFFSQDTFSFSFQYDSSRPSFGRGKK